MAIKCGRNRSQGENRIKKNMEKPLKQRTMENIECTQEMARVYQ
jgi:hypothetical protein